MRENYFEYGDYGPDPFEPWDDFEVDYEWEEAWLDCDFCDSRAQGKDMFPEEGGAWACRKCMEKWDAEDDNG